MKDLMAGVLWLAFVAFLGWLFLLPIRDYLRDEVTVYNASCASGGPVLPSTVALRDVFGHDGFGAELRRYEETLDSCEILPGARTTYKLNRARGEVAYLSLGQVSRLTDCAFVDRKNWSCSYADRSGKVVVLDGLRAYSRDELIEYPQLTFFSLRRWQWWLVTVLWSSGDGPNGSWLIPEQRESY